MAEDSGALLLRAGLITNEQLLLARQEQREQGGTLGEHLVLTGTVDDAALAELMRTRLMLPQVGAGQLVEISPHIIKTVPSHLAEEFRCLPIRYDRAGNLTVALSDPTATHAVDELAFFTGHYVVRAVALQSQIAWGLVRYYNIVTPLARYIAKNVNKFTLPGAMPTPGKLDELSAQPREAPPRRSSARRQSEPPAPIKDESGPVPVIIEPDPEPPRPPPLRVRPPTEQRYISFLQEDTPATGPMPTLRRDPPPTPPELEARAGELNVRTGPVRATQAEQELPAVVISDYLGVSTGPSSVSGELSIPAPDPRPLPLPDPDTPLERSASALPKVIVPEPLQRSRSATPPRRPIGSTPLPMQRFDSDSETPLHVHGPMDDEDSDRVGDDTDEEREPGDEAVVLLERPKGKSKKNRRRIASTRLGLGIPAAGPRVQGDGAAEEPALEALSERAQDGQAEALAGDGKPEARPPAKGVVTAKSGPQRKEPQPGARVGRVPGTLGGDLHPRIGEDIAEAPYQSADSGRAVPVPTPLDGPVPVATSDGPTMQMDVPPPYPRGWSGPQPAADSIAMAAAAAAEASARRPRAYSDPNFEAIPTPIPRYRAFSENAEDTTDRFAKIRALGQADDMEDEFGPPGSTIPPPYLGAIHREDTGSDVEASSDLIPIHTDDPEEALDIRPIVKPVTTKGRDEDFDDVETGIHARSRSGSVVEARSWEFSEPSHTAFDEAEPVGSDEARALEESSLRLVEVLRQLDQADTRDQVVDILLAYLGYTHGRVAFFAIKSGRLSTWKKSVNGQRHPTTNDPILVIDYPSAFRDIASARMPFHGRLADRHSREFLVHTFGSVGETSLLLPVAVRGRVVGMLYGDTAQKQVFDQHAAVVTRAAGVAFERILKQRKS